MIDFLLELLVEALVQALGELIVELAWELGWASLRHAFRSKRRAHPVLAVMGWAIIGAICGAISALLLPHRVLPWHGRGGLSMFVAPFLTGAVMKLVGDRRREAGKDTTALATFWGGAIFALALSAVRFWCVRAH